MEIEINKEFKNLVLELMTNARKQNWYDFEDSTSALAIKEADEIRFIQDGDKILSSEKTVSIGYKEYNLEEFNEKVQSRFYIDNIEKFLKSYEDMHYDIEVMKDSLSRRDIVKAYVSIIKEYLNEFVFQGRADDDRDTIDEVTKLIFEIIDKSEEISDKIALSILKEESSSSVIFSLLSITTKGVSPITWKNRLRLRDNNGTALVLRHALIVQREIDLHGTLDTDWFMFPDIFFTEVGIELLFHIIYMFENNGD